MTSRFEPLVVADRSGLDEVMHQGAVVALDRDGSITFAVGDPTMAVYPRSCTKPMQGEAMVRLGLSLPPPLLALACASHLGESRHVDGTREILASVGLTDEALGNTPDLPAHRASALAVECAGGGPAPVYMNCSGKHAAMVVTSLRRGWATDSSYLQPSHPLQQYVTEVVTELTGEEPSHVGVDGCGAPIHAVSLAGLARGVRAVAMAQGAVYQAMTSHPEMVGGTGHHGTALMQAIPGLLAKDGAAGVYVGALPDGRAVALKLADGASAPRPLVLVAALRALGVDVSGADAVTRVAVLGHGRPVGEYRMVGLLA